MSPPAAPLGSARRIDAPPRVVEGDDLDAELVALDTVLRALIGLRERGGLGAALRVLRYASSYLQVPDGAV